MTRARTTTETQQPFSTPLRSMPTIPTLPRGSLSVPGEIRVNSDASGNNNGSSDSSDSSTSSTSTSTQSSGIPTIPAYHALGAARQAQQAFVVKSKSVPVDSRAHEKYSKKFVRTVPIQMEDLKEVEIIVPKTARGLIGSKENLMYQKLATDAIDNKFGVPSHLITNRGGAEEGDQLKHLYIQQQYVDNLSKIEAVKQRIVEYDMVDVAMVPVGIRNPHASDMADIFEFDEAHILTSWDTIAWNTACTYQWAINSAMSDEDQLSSKWLKMLLYESCTTEMKEVIMLEYNNLEDGFRGGVTFAYILCRKLFGLNRDTTASLVSFLKLFLNKGLRRYQGENVSLARKELLAVCSRLAEAKELPQETPLDILHGLTLCSVQEFKTLFEHKLQQTKSASLEGNKHLSQSEILSEVRVLLSTASQYYGSLNMSDKWNLPRNQQQVNVFGTPNEITCWNCGKKGHGLNDCSEPRNDKRIAENREKWEASSGKSKSRKGKNKSAGGGNNYEREKWAPPKSGESGVRHIDGTPHTYCGKTHNGIACSWNTSHSTSYHRKWVSQGQAFNLAHECPTHELVLKTSGTGTKPKSSSSSNSSKNTANSCVIPDSVRNAISQLNDSVRTPSEQLLMDSVMKSLCLN